MKHLKRFAVSVVFLYAALVTPPLLQKNDDKSLDMVFTVWVIFGLTAFACREKD